MAFALDTEKARGICLLVNFHETGKLREVPGDAEVTRINFPNRKPSKPPAKPKQASQQKRATASEDRKYAKLRTEYLRENPYCVLCERPSAEVHHILRGANRRRGLLNTDTWLACCGSQCHDAIERLNWRVQVCLKQAAILETIERLRGGIL